MVNISLQSAPLRSRWQAFLERRGIPELCLAVLTLLVYARSLTLGFVYDDHVIFKDPWVLSWKAIPSLFGEDLIADHASNFYRPLAILWHGLVYSLAGTNPVAWHFSGILLHVACVLLVFRLTVQVLNNRALTFFAAAVFALHPTHVEAVSWVSDAGDPLLAALMLLSALALLRWFQSGHPVWWMACWLLAFGCCFVKETGVLMPVLLLVLATHVERKVSQPAMVLAGLAFLISSCGFLLLRNHVLHGFSNPLSKAGNLEMLLTLPAALWFYLSHLVFPARLGPFYPLEFVSNWQSTAFLVPLLLLAAILAFLLWLHRRLSDRRIFWFCVVWTLVPLVAPLYLKLFPEFELVHDRYLYIPTIALGVALAAIWRRLSDALPEARAGNYQVLVAAAALVTLGMGTILYQGVWTSDLTLFQRAIELTPRNARALVNLGVAKLQQGNYEEGTALLHRALEIQPDNAFALFDLGNAAWENNDPVTAEKYFEKALRIETRFKWWLLLAEAKFKLGKLPEAEWSVQRALAMDPTGPEAHVLLGAIRLVQGNIAAAVREFRVELQLNPANPVALEMLQMAQKQLAEQSN